MKKEETMKKILVVSLLTLLLVSCSDEKANKTNKTKKEVKTSSALEAHKSYMVRSNVLECMMLSSGAKSAIFVETSISGGVASYTSNNKANIDGGENEVIDTSTGRDSGWRFEQTSHCLTIDIVGATEEDFAKSKVEIKKTGQTKIINPQGYIILKPQNTGAIGSEPAMRINIAIDNGFFVEFDCVITGNPNKEYYPSECR